LQGGPEDGHGLIGWASHGLQEHSAEDRHEHTDGREELLGDGVAIGADEGEDELRSEELDQAADDGRSGDEEDEPVD